MGCSGSPTATKKLAECQLINYQTLQDWCFREFKDPVALPYALAIERFCANRWGDIADEFDETLDDFCLSHSSPVRIPLEDSAAYAADPLTRVDIIHLRQIFEHCTTIKNFKFSVKWAKHRQTRESSRGNTKQSKLW